MMLLPQTGVIMVAKVSKITPRQEGDIAAAQLHALISGCDRAGNRSKASVISRQHGAAGSHRNQSGGTTGADDATPEPTGSKAASGTGRGDRLPHRCVRDGNRWLTVIRRKLSGGVRREYRMRTRSVFE